MGLDAIELVMEVEERFNVSLQDSDWTRVRTVADLAAIVLAKMTVSGDVCPSQRAFYELRRAMGTVGVGRERIRPRSVIDDLVPGLTRGVWKRLCAADGRLAVLEADEGRGSSNGLLWLLVIVTTGAIVTPLIGGCAAVLVAAAAVAIGVFICQTIANGRRVRLQPAYATVGDIARSIAPMASSAWAGERIAREAEVLEEVRRITARCVGMPVDRVQARSQFVRDLGMD